MLATITELDDTDLTATIHDSHHSLSRHRARFILGLAEFHARQLAGNHGSPNTVAWLTRHHDLARRTAFEYLGVGTKLRRFRLVAHSFLTGDLSYSKVRLLLRHLTEANEDELLNLALRHTLAELEQALAGRARSRGRSAPTNSLRIINDEETGGLRFWGTLDPERAAEFLAALKIGELANLRDLSDLPPDTLTDPAAVDTEVEQTRAREKSRTRFGSPLSATVLPAFLSVLNMVRTTPHNSRRAPGAQVNVLLTEDGRAVLPERHGAETADLLRLLINGTVRYHLLDRRGLRITLSRSTRLVSHAQETALLALWGHRCAAPGCHHSRFLEFHHIHEWSRGGATDLNNLIPLCSGCHSLVTAGHLTIHADRVSPELLRFRFPGGHSHTAAARRLPVADEQLGPWADTYTEGPVPTGDDHLLRTWHRPDSFDDADAAEPAAHPEQSAQLRTLHRAMPRRKGATTDLDTRQSST